MEWVAALGTSGREGRCMVAKVPMTREEVAARMRAGKAKKREEEVERKRRAAAALNAPVVVQSGEYRQWSEGIEAYGRLWPVSTIIEIESALYAHKSVREQTPNALPRHEHFIKYLQALVPTSFAWHRWAYEGAELWCEDGWTCIGAAGTGKSAMFGLFTLGDWIAAPAQTVTVLVSTSIDSLKARIWKYICQWYPAVDERFRIGHFRQANPLGLLYVADPTPQVPQPQWQGAGLLCVGFKQGDSSESIKNHLGRHLPRNRIVVDELQGVNRAVLDIWWNMGASGEFRFGGFGNPMSAFDPLADASLPLGMNRLSAIDWIHREMMDVGQRRKKTWKTDLGRCLMFDGCESPALDNPKFHWLIGADHIEKSKKSGENTAQWYTFIRGVFPPSGGANTLISAKEISETGSEATGVIWDGPRVDWLWGDLAHEGEDDAELMRARVGPTLGGTIMIELMEAWVIGIDLKAGFISQQLAKKVVEIAKRYDIPAHRIAIDATATQGSMIDTIEEKLKARGVCRIHASGPPSKLLVKQGWPMTCKDAYENRAAELAGNFREFLRAGQIRGVDSVLAQQACSRVVLGQEEAMGKLHLHPDKRAGNGGKSPNRLDLVSVGCTALRETAGIHPNSGKPAPDFTGNDDRYDAWIKRARALDVRFRGRGGMDARLRRYGARR